MNLIAFSGQPEFRSGSQLATSRRPAQLSDLFAQPTIPVAGSGSYPRDREHFRAIIPTTQARQGRRTAPPDALDAYLNSAAPKRCSREPIVPGDGSDESFLAASPTSRGVPRTRKSVIIRLPLLSDKHRSENWYNEGYDTHADRE